jgi:hypothetical protein
MYSSTGLSQNFTEFLNLANDNIYKFSKSHLLNIYHGTGLSQNFTEFLSLANDNLYKFSKSHFLKIPSGTVLSQNFTVSQFHFFDDVAYM